VKVGAFTRSGYVINNPRRLLAQRFKFVFHQVRHPLRVIKTLVERCQNWDKFWKFIASVKGMSDISEDRTPLVSFTIWIAIFLLCVTDGSIWCLQTNAMLLYIFWNKHIERYADLRFQGEITSPRDVCRWSEFPDAICDNAKTEQEIVEPVTTRHLSKRKLQQAQQEEPQQLEHPHRRRLMYVSRAQQRQEDLLRSKNLKSNRHNVPYNFEIEPPRTHRIPNPHVPKPAPNKYNYGNVTWSLLDKENVILANEVR
jgi:hypothetical protein